MLLQLVFVFYPVTSHSLNTTVSRLRNSERGSRLVVYACRGELFLLFFITRLSNNSNNNIRSGKGD